MGHPYQVRKMEDVYGQMITPFDEPSFLATCTAISKVEQNTLAGNGVVLNIPIPVGKRVIMPILDILNAGAADVLIQIRTSDVGISNANFLAGTQIKSWLVVASEEKRCISPSESLIIDNTQGTVVLYALLGLPPLIGGVANITGTEYLGWNALVKLL